VPNLKDLSGLAGGLAGDMKANPLKAGMKGGKAVTGAGISAVGAVAGVASDAAGTGFDKLDKVAGQDWKEVKRFDVDCWTKQSCSREGKPHWKEAPMIFDVQDYCDEDKLVIEIFDDTIPVSPPKIPGGFIGGDKKPLGTIDIALTSVVTDDTSPLQFRWYDIVRVEPPSGLASRLRVRTEWWSAEKLKGDRFASSTSKTVWDREHDADMSEMSTGSVTNSSPLKTPTRPLSREFESSPDASPDQRLAPSPMNKRQSVPLVGGGGPASVAGLLIKRGSRRKKFNKFRYLVLEAGEPLRIWAKAADCNKKPKYAIPWELIVAIQVTYVERCFEIFVEDSSVRFIFMVPDDSKVPLDQWISSLREHREHAVDELASMRMSSTKSTGSSAK